MKETDLAKPVVEWLAEQHWDVYQEVQFRSMDSIADIVAVRNGIIWIIECKTSYGLAVLGQAAAWDVHYRSVAVPKSKEPRGRHDYFVARDYFRVGILEVGIRSWESGFSSSVSVAIDAPLFLRASEYRRRWFRQDHIRNQLACLTPLHKTYAQAGSNKHDHLTPYKQTMIDVRKVIEANPGCSVQFLYEKIGTGHYSSKSSFMGNVVKCLQAYEHDWCIVNTDTKPYALFVKADAK